MHQHIKAVVPLAWDLRHLCKNTEWQYVTIVPEVSGEERWKKLNGHIFDSQITLHFASFALLWCRVCDNARFPRGIRNFRNLRKGLHRTKQKLVEKEQHQAPLHLTCRGPDLATHPQKPTNRCMIFWNIYSYLIHLDTAIIWYFYLVPGGLPSNSKDVWEPNVQQNNQEALVHLASMSFNLSTRGSCHRSRKWRRLVPTLSSEVGEWAAVNRRLFFARVESWTSTEGQ